MNTCDTCKWWGHELWSHVVEGGPSGRICGCNKVQECYDLTTCDDGVLLHKSIDTSVITGPKFGCVHHSPKNEV